MVVISVSWNESSDTVWALGLGEVCRVIEPILSVITTIAQILLVLELGLVNVFWFIEKIILVIG